MKAFTIFGGFWGQNQLFLQISETSFSKQFSIHNFFLFSILHCKMSRNMCKLRHKVRNRKNLPHEILNFRNIFFLSNFMDNLVLPSTSMMPYYQIVFFSKYFFGFLFLTQGCLRTCVFGVTNCVMPKRVSVQLLHGQMNLDLSTGLPRIVSNTLQVLLLA